MDNLTAKFDINIVGEDSGNPYTGSFTVRTLLTRNQLAQADMNRRLILGPIPEGAAPMPRIATDAFIAGQLSVRIIEAPQWFDSAGIGGIDLFDTNVTEEIFRKALEAESQRKESLNKKADTAAEKLKKKAKAE